MTKRHRIIEFICIGRLENYYFSLIFGIVFLVFGFFVMFMAFLLININSLINVCFIKVIVLVFLFIGRLLSYIFGSILGKYIYEIYPFFACIIFVLYVFYLFFWTGANFGNLICYVFKKIIKGLRIFLKKR